MEGTFLELTLAEYHIDALIDYVNQAKQYGIHNQAVDGRVHDGITDDKLEDGIQYGEVGIDVHTLVGDNRAGIGHVDKAKNERDDRQLEAPMGCIHSVGRYDHLVVQIP